MTTPTRKVHCWHDDGGLVFEDETREGTFAVSVRCCHCNAEGRQEWTSGTMPIDGHGPYVTAPRMVYRPITGPAECRR